MVTETTIPKGYKKTEIGVIPEDWDVVEIREIAENERIPSGIYKEKSLYGTGTKIIKLGDVFSSDFFNPSKVQRVILNISELHDNQAKIGDIFIALASVKLEGIGKVMFVDDLDEDTAYDHNVALIRIKKQFENKFVFYYLKSPLMRQIIGSLSTQVGTTFLKSSSIRSFKILLPPTKEEQTQIAQALSDTDALIESLNKLIAKKKNLKQGTMQQLLTGKKRLPGFSGKWEVKKLGEVCRITTGKKDVNEGNPSGAFPFFTCSSDLPPKKWTQRRVGVSIKAGS